MSTRLDKKMAELKAAGKKGIFIYITAGAPDVETTLRAVREAEKAGADVIELGLPFSYAHHFGTGITTQAAEVYRAAFRPSAVLDAPHLMVSASVVVATSRWM